MIAVVGDVGEENIAGGNASVCKYARLAVVIQSVRCVKRV